MKAATRCPGCVSGEHAMWTMYRFAWPWGVIFPKMRACLYCGAKR